MEGQGLTASERDAINKVKTIPRPIRTSSAARANARHGRVYEEHPNGTIRAVSPEPPSNAPFSDPESVNLPSPVNWSRGHYSTQPMEGQLSLSNTDEEGASESQQRKLERRSTHRGDPPPDASPNSIVRKARRRLGSITNSASFSSKQEDSMPHISYPTSVQASVFPDLSNIQPQLPRTPRRTTTSEKTATNTSLPTRSPGVLDSDSNRILQLMKTTCGRMHGILFFRPIGSSAWASGYCAISVTPGSLVCQTKDDATVAQTIIPDLRGCSVRTRYDPQTQSTYLSVILATSGFGFQLRPPVPETFDSWLAALLCWQPLRPKGVHNKMPKLQSVSMNDRRPIDQRRLSDMASPRSGATIKVGKMLLWYGVLPAGSQRALSKRVGDTEPLQEHNLWRRVSCTLHENGTLKLLAEENAKPICVICLSHLARCAIQRLHESVLDAKFCIAICPRYAVPGSGSHVPSAKPIVLCLESKIAFEAWYVLFRALTVPELYGPEQDGSELSGETDCSGPSCSGHGMFRVERTLSVKITEVKFTHSIAVVGDQQQSDLRLRQQVPERTDLGVYVDVLLGRDIRARTTTRPCNKSAFWAEEFQLEDLPSVLSRVLVAVKIGIPGEKEWTMTAHDNYEIPGAEDIIELEGIEIASHDPIYGKVEIPIDEIDYDRPTEKWWPLSDNNGHMIGKILMRIQLSEATVLMESDYAPLYSLLHNFDNGLIPQIAQILGSDLKQLSDVLLDIFQITGRVGEWISNLIEEEIDGIYKSSTPARMRFSGRLRSNESHETTQKRELLVRDLSRSATVEANLLFRGNSLITKALDSHMKRVGFAYLEQTVGELLRNVVATNLDCEVDPVKIHSAERMEKNWSTLIHTTSTIWHAISTSASHCPLDMRVVFKHIRSCAEDRYGSFIRTVKYTSVSGFLFLRFFCPAILNPKLFGLLDEFPPERARRTFTLVAKSLIVLANMSKFGQKEPWMEPMNRFLTTALPEFRNFVEEVCAVEDPGSAAMLEPQYTASLQIKTRLPPISREGLPSLPFLLDAPKLYSTLVEIWLDHAPQNLLDMGVDACVRSFHKACLELRHKTNECMVKAEPAEAPNGRLERQWQQILREKQTNLPDLPPNLFEQHFTRYHSYDTSAIDDEDLTALPQPPEVHPRNKPSHIAEPAIYTSDVQRDGTRSPILSPTPHPVRANSRAHVGMQPTITTEHRGLTKAKHSSNTSLEAMDDTRTRTLPPSRDGSSRPRLLDLMGASSRKRITKETVSEGGP